MNNIFKLLKLKKFNKVKQIIEDNTDIDLNIFDKSARKNRLNNQNLCLIKITLTLDR